MGVRWQKRRGVCLDLLLLLLVGLKSREGFAWAQQAPQQTVRPVHYTSDCLGFISKDCGISFISARQDCSVACISLLPPIPFGLFLSNVFALMRDALECSSQESVQCVAAACRTAFAIVRLAAMGAKRVGTCAHFLGWARPASCLRTTPQLRRMHPLSHPASSMSARE